MTQPTPSFRTLAVTTLRDPRTAARHLLGLNLPVQALWEALALGAVLMTILLMSVLLLAAGGTPDPMAVLLLQTYGNPLAVSIGLGLNAAVSAAAIHLIGRQFGGTGSFEGALVLFAWHQIFVLILVLAVFAVSILLPFLLIFALVGWLVVYFWVLTQFICELHGFRRPGAVFGMIVLSMLLINFVMSMVLGVIGAVTGGGAPNV